jgi:hypothetical protein
VTNQEEELIVLSELKYRKSMVRISILIGTCFVLLIVLTASFIVTRIGQEQFDRVQQAQEKQGQTVEQRLCDTLEGLRSLQPPSGDPGSNPSRAYLQEEHAKLSELSVDVGCKG